MNESQSALEKWLDRDFFQTGAFLTSVDGEIVVLGKGGAVTEAQKFKKSSRPVFYLKDFYQGDRKSVV